MSNGDLPPWEQARLDAESTSGDADLNGSIIIIDLGFLGTESIPWTVILPGMLARVVSSMSHEFQEIDAVANAANALVAGLLKEETYAQGTTLNFNQKQLLNTMVQSAFFGGEQLTG